MNQVATGMIACKLFDPKDIFIYDVGVEVFVRVDKQSSQAERKSRFQFAYVL
jgi:hypothetical protein